jgi:type IV pilus assembly protein PilA
MRHDSRGFTLIELLTVVVILGILAMIALPTFVNTREKAYLSAMRSDLRNLATAQEDYFAGNYIYASDPALLTGSRSQRVILGIPESTDVGWRATATYSAAPHLVCELYYGTAAGNSTATQEGSVFCNN